MRAKPPGQGQSAGKGIDPRGAMVQSGGMKRLVFLSLSVALLGACSNGLRLFDRGRAEAPALAPGLETPRPVARPGSGPVAPARDAVTVEQFDTTSEAERAAAADAGATGGEVALGRTIATLGSPAKPGFWLETPLVSAPAKGRVVAANGESVLVDLLPLDAPTGAGSHISLAALRLLGIGLTGLHELSVFRL